MRRCEVLVGICLALVLGCDPDTFSQSFHHEPHAPSITTASIEALDTLGPTVADGGVNFSIYSERAERIELLLFDDPEADRPTQRFELTRFGDVWNVWVQSIGYGQHYGFAAWGPNWPYHADWHCGGVQGFVSDVDAEGNRFNPNKLLLDPYAKAVHRDFDWSRGSAASGPARAECTWGASAKSIVVATDYAWSENETTWRDNRMREDFEGHGWQDLVIYEVHPKGFTMDPTSGAEHPGSFSGIGDMAPYLADLGVTAVELMPVHEKALDGGYWGYWNVSFFAPEITYSSSHDGLLVLDEFKEMVDQLHQHGIEVILDVVFNHTGEGGLWRERRYIDDLSLDPSIDAVSINFEPKEIASIYSYRGIDNHAYYALPPDNQTYWNNTGVGNQTRPNHTPFRRLTLDSLRFYVEELHVDGFRFDLAAILGEQDQNYNTWDDPMNTVLGDILTDETLNRYNTRIIAEPWAAAGGYPTPVGQYPAHPDRPGVGWYEWNPHFRHWWRSFMNLDDWRMNSTQGPSDGGNTLTGSQGVYSHNGRRPYHSINYVTSHDGFTMYDLFSFATKQNRCGMLNPVCCSTPASPWCETDSGDEDNRSRDWGDEAMKRQLMRNLFVAMAISHGTPMLLGGDEWMRTQFGNNNAYSTGADNAWNWFRWGEWRAAPERVRMHDFVRDVFRFRREHAYAFAPTDFMAGAPFSWNDAGNVPKSNWTDRHVMIHYHDATFGPELAILINLERGPVTFTLPSGRLWRRLLDTQSYFEDRGASPEESGNITLESPELLPEASYGVPASSIVILEASE